MSNLLFNYRQGSHLLFHLHTSSCIHQQIHQDNQQQDQQEKEWQQYIFDLNYYK